jgi:hypothetical protein
MSSHTVVDVLPQDAIPSIDDPTFAESFNGTDDETVLVVETDGTARAYPTRILQNHEVVNNSDDSGPFAVTWCPLCGSGVVYDRRIDGRTLTFGVSGKLVDNDLVLYDRETESEWKQSSGRCLAGPLSGTELTVLSARTTTLGAFRERYSDGVVLQVPEWKSGDYGTDRFADYADTDYVGPGGDARLGESIDDWAYDFGPKAVTLGLTIDGHARGYPRPVVERAGGAVTDTLGDTAVVVFATPSGAFAYEGTGTFEPTPEPGRFLADGTVWDAVTGEAEDGRKLAALPSRRLFAFAWRDDHGPDAFYEG